MVTGAFKSFKHEHIFQKKKNKTLMIDMFYYKSPFGILGKVANILFLNRYMTGLLKKRNSHLKDKAQNLF